MNTINLTDTSRPFLAYLEDWYRQLPPAALADIVGGAPERVALISIDVINGFCVEGPLASARVGGWPSRWPRCSARRTRWACATSR